MSTILRVLVVLGGTLLANIIANGIVHGSVQVLARQDALRPYLVGWSAPTGVSLLAELILSIALVAVLIRVVYAGRPFDRIVVIGFAYVLATVAAALSVIVLFAGFAVTMGRSPPGLGEVGLILLFGVPFAAFLIFALALLPAIGVIAYAERTQVYTWGFYAIAGGSVAGAISLIYCIVLSAYGSGGVGGLFTMLAIFAPAGSIGGYVYWAIAGRNAGMWGGGPSSGAFSSAAASGSSRRLPHPRRQNPRS